jgi:site-specific recombinase XerD
MTIKELITLDKTGDLATLDRRALDENPAAVYLADLAPSSRRTMLSALDTMASLLAEGSDAYTCPWSRIRFQHVQALRSMLAERYAPATANRYLSTLRGTLREAWRLGQITAEEYQRATDVKAVTGERLPAGRSITPGELQVLLETCADDQTAAGARDAAIVALLYSRGLRRAELVGLDVDDYDRERGSLRVLGKRNKERLAYIVQDTAAALADWLAFRGDVPGPLFWPIRKGGELQVGRRLTTRAVYHILQKRAGQA